MTRPPGEGRARPVVVDGGPWKGISTAEQVERIARGSTPVREYVDGKFQPWIDTRPTTRLGRNDLADGAGTPSRSRDASARTGSPDKPFRAPVEGSQPTSSTPRLGVLVNVDPSTGPLRGSPGRSPTEAG